MLNSTALTIGLNAGILSLFETITAQDVVKTVLVPEIRPGSAITYVASLKTPIKNGMVFRQSTRHADE